MDSNIRIRLEMEEYVASSEKRTTMDGTDHGKKQLDINEIILLMERNDDICMTCDRVWSR